MDDVLRESDKLIMLILKSEWCRECFELLSVIRDVRRSDLEILVADVDERPDLLERFNFGGLPSVVFLRSGRIVYGFSGAPSKTVLEEVLKTVLRGETKEYDLGLISEDRPPTIKPDKSMVYRILRILEEKYDFVYGGFKGEYKMPPPAELRFLLSMYMEYGVQGYLEMVRHTMASMYRGGNYLEEYGGFSRVSRSPTWGDPDDALLAEVNAELLTVAEALMRFDDGEWLKAVRDGLVRLLTKALYRGGWVRRGMYSGVLDERAFMDVAMTAASNLLR